MVTPKQLLLFYNTTTPIATLTTTTLTLTVKVAQATIAMEGISKLNPLPTAPIIAMDAMVEKLFLSNTSEHKPAEQLSKKFSSLRV